MISFRQDVRELWSFSLPGAQTLEASNFPQVSASSPSSFLPNLAPQLCCWLAWMQTWGKVLSPRSGKALKKSSDSHEAQVLHC